MEINNPQRRLCDPCLNELKKAEVNTRTLEKTMYDNLLEKYVKLTEYCMELENERREKNEQTIS